MQIRTILINDFPDVAVLIREAFTPTDFGYGNEAELVEKFDSVKNMSLRLSLLHSKKSKLSVMDY